MSEIEIAFHDKAKAFSEGRLDEVAQTLAVDATVRVGPRPYEVIGRAQAKVKLVEYFEGLRGLGYAHTEAKVLHEEEVAPGQAYVLAEYVHCGFDGDPIDTLQASFFLEKGDDGLWCSSVVEFVNEPVAYAA